MAEGVIVPLGEGMVCDGVGVGVIEGGTVYSHDSVNDAGSDPALLAVMMTYRLLGW